MLKYVIYCYWSTNNNDNRNKNNSALRTRTSFNACDDSALTITVFKYTVECTLAYD